MDPALIVAEQVTVLAGSSHLMGERWVLTSYQEQNPVGGHQPTLQFTLEQISGNTGCNQYGDFLLFDAFATTLNADV